MRPRKKNKKKFRVRHLVTTGDLDERLTTWSSPLVAKRASEHGNLFELASDDDAPGSSPRFFLLFGMDRSSLDLVLLVVRSESYHQSTWSNTKMYDTM